MGTSAMFEVRVDENQMRGMLEKEDDSSSVA